MTKPIPNHLLLDLIRQLPQSAQDELFANWEAGRARDAKHGRFDPGVEWLERHYPNVSWEAFNAGTTFVHYKGKGEWGPWNVMVMAKMMTKRSILEAGPTDDSTILEMLDQADGLADDWVTFSGLVTMTDRAQDTLIKVDYPFWHREAGFMFRTVDDIMESARYAYASVGDAAEHCLKWHDPNHREDDET